MKTPFLILFLFLSFSSVLKAQLIIYSKPVKIGPVVGVQYSDIDALTPNNNQRFVSDEVNDVRGKDSWGIHAGVTLFMELNNQFAVRGNAIVSYQQNEIYFDLIDREDYTQSVQPVMIEFPIHFLYSANKNKKVAPSIAFGFNYMRDITFYKNEKLSLDRHDVGLEIGAGFFIKKNYKIHPEILASFQGV